MCIWLFFFDKTNSNKRAEYRPENRRSYVTRSIRTIAATYHDILVDGAHVLYAYVCVFGHYCTFEMHVLVRGRGGDRSNTIITAEMSLARGRSLRSVHCICSFIVKYRRYPWRVAFVRRIGDDRPFERRVLANVSTENMLSPRIVWLVGEGDVRKNVCPVRHHKRYFILFFTRLAVAFCFRNCKNYCVPLAFSISERSNPANDL